MTIQNERQGEKPPDLSPVEEMWSKVKGILRSIKARTQDALLDAIGTALRAVIIASVLLSPVQGPLGIANSALVLVSIIIIGLAADLAGGVQNAAKGAARPAGVG